MGAKESKPVNGMPTEQDFQSLTGMFTREEVDKLWEKFRAVSNSQVKDYHIDIKEFQTALGLSANNFTERIFAAFDSDRAEGIDFMEFVHGLYVLSPRASLEEKARFCFKVYDKDGNGDIEKEELLEVLKFSLSCNSSVRIPEAHIKKLINATFAKMDHDGSGGISLEEFIEEATKNPMILNCVNLDVEGIFKEETQ